MSDLLLHYMPRVRRDINECADFVGRQPQGKPQDRKADIDRAIEAICAHPELRPRKLYRPESGLWLRRRKAAQFVIVYAYIPAEEPGAAEHSVHQGRQVRQRGGRV